MRLASTIAIYGGGPGSGCNPDKGKCGRKPGSRRETQTQRKSRLAKASYIPVTAEKYRRAKANEMLLAKTLGGQGTPNNSAFDVMAGNNAFEVKTIEEGKNDKITMHPDALARKVSTARKSGLTPHTVVFDMRHGKLGVYYHAGLGSFRLKGMEKLNSVYDLQRRLGHGL